MKKTNKNKKNDKKNKKNKKNKSVDDSSQSKASKNIGTRAQRVNPVLKSNNRPPLADQPGIMLNIGERETKKRHRNDMVVSCIG